jgi:hypothetical protein
MAAAELLLDRVVGDRAVEALVADRGEFAPTEGRVRGLPLDNRPPDRLRQPPPVLGCLRRT